MRVIRGVAGLGLVVLLALGGALPAYGGGPTSVLIVSPDNNAAAALYTTQTEYQQLAGYVDETGQKTEVLKADERSAHESSRFIRLTWLIHDTTVWRTDWIYPDSDGGPWIATRLVREGGDIWQQPVRWHTSSDPKALMALLGRLGLTEKKSDGGYVVATPAVPEPQPAPAAAAVEDSPTGWLWLFPGLAAGAALMLLAVKLVPVWQRRDRASRVQLIDQ
jgi:hypothetical protein